MESKFILIKIFMTTLAHGPNTGSKNWTAPNKDVHFKFTVLSDPHQTDKRTVGFVWSSPFMGQTTKQSPLDFPVKNDLRLGHVPVNLTSTKGVGFFLVNERKSSAARLINRGKEKGAAITFLGFGEKLREKRVKKLERKKF